MEKRVRAAARNLFLLFLCIMALAMPGKVYAASVSQDMAVEKWIKKDGKVYFRQEDGTLRKGWLVVKKRRYYLDKNIGARVTGWRNIDGKRYYFHPKNGRAATGWFSVDGKKYYAFANGILKTGWYSENGDRYYLQTDKKGAMKADGWKKIEGKRYYFYPDGRMARRLWIDEKHYVDIKGVSRPDIVKNKKDTFRWPLDASWKQVSSPFGYREPISVGTSNHDGIDIPADAGALIYAAKTGYVIERGYSDSEGNHIVIDHKNGMTTTYMHMTKFDPAFSVGSRVKKGQVIGYVGSTGWATGSHLHFGVKINGELTDPLKFVCQP